MRVVSSEAQQMGVRWPFLAHSRTASDLAACAAMLRQGSRSFHAASLLLPARVREPAIALYAFCRLADDAVDHGGQQAALRQLRLRLDGAYAGRPADHPADRALAAVIARHALPRTLPEALLEGFAWDVEGRRYEDLSALLAYAARVAGTVGAMMAVLMGSPLAARACDLGVAMQLTNIARDVGEDARAGRLYLPRAWLLEAGIDPDHLLAAPTHSPALAGVVRRLLEVADALYARADAGIARLPADCRPGIFAARLLYAGIGDEVARSGYDSVTARARVPGWRKLGSVARALALAAGGPALIQAHHAPCLSETRFLVDAIPVGAALRTATRVGWVLDLFGQLDQRFAPAALARLP